MPDNYSVFVAQPGYGGPTAGAARGFWRATRLPESRVVWQYQEGSLLANAFNRLWCTALNRAAMGRDIRYFAMIHSDIEPEDGWLDRMVDLLEIHDLDILGAVAPIKDLHGLTSLALERPDRDNWRVLCRLTMADVLSLPPVFTSEHVGHRLLLNTGLWVCRFDPAWRAKVHFRINDRIVIDPTGQYHAQVEPEDWYFCRLCHELGLKVGATRSVRLEHRGQIAFPSDGSWGSAIDRAYLDHSPIPPDAGPGFRFPRDVDGWLTYDEGRALYELAEGKRVLEIGSYCGRSTICLAQSAERVTACDTWDGRGTPEPRNTFEEFEFNIEQYSLSHRIDVLFGDHAPVGTFDLIFIDGAHDYESVKADIARSLTVLAPGGLLAFHDFREHPSAFDGHYDPGVARAVRELLGQGAELITTVGSLAVVDPSAVLAPLEI